MYKDKDFVNEKNYKYKCFNRDVTIKTNHLRFLNRKLLDMFLHHNEEF